MRLELLSSYTKKASIEKFPVYKHRPIYLTEQNVSAQSTPIIVFDSQYVGKRYKVDILIEADSAIPK